MQARVHMETLVGRPDRAEQVEHAVSPEQLVVPLRQEQHRAMDRRRVVQRVVASWARRRRRDRVRQRRFAARPRPGEVRESCPSTSPSSRPEQIREPPAPAARRAPRASRRPSRRSSRGHRARPARTPVSKSSPSVVASVRRSPCTGPSIAAAAKPWCERAVAPARGCNPGACRPSRRGRGAPRPSRVAILPVSTARPGIVRVARADIESALGHALRGHPLADPVDAHLDDAIRAVGRAAVPGCEMRLAEVRRDVPLEVPQLDEQRAEQEALLVDMRASARHAHGLPSTSPRLNQRNAASYPGG